MKAETKFVEDLGNDAIVVIAKENDESATLNNDVQFGIQPVEGGFFNKAHLYV